MPNPHPQRPFRARSGPPPEGHHTMRESALTGQLGAPCEGIFAHSVRPSGGCPARALKGLCG
eukprot:13169756-Alexandrium_andersonii.AAC.1